MPPGPPPKRSEERRRRNKDAVETEKVDIAELASHDVEIPVADENWHPVAAMWYESLKSSGQSIFYEPSDWATAYVLADVLDRWLKPQDVKVGQIGVGNGDSAGGDITYVFEQKILAMPGGTLTAILKGMSALMVTEGERRRLKIELERQKAKNAAAGGGSNVVPITQQRQQRFKREAQK